MINTQAFQNIGNSFKKITDSFWYIVGINLFVLFCWIFNLVFLGFAVFVIVLLATLLTQKNINSLIPFLASIVFIVSDTGVSGATAVVPVFMDTLYIIMYCCIPLIVAAFVFFFIRNKQKIRIGSFSHGMLIFFVVAFFGGAGTEYFTLKHLLTLVLWFAALYGVYLLFYNLVDTKAEGFKKYFSFAFFASAALVTVELGIAYIKSGNFFNNFSHTPYVGWGIGPTIGQVLTMYLPFAFYLLYASKNRGEVIFYNISIVVLLVALLLTRSRAGLLAMGLGAIPLYIFTHIKMNKDLQKVNLYTLLGISIAALLVFAAFNAQVISAIKSVLKNFQLSGREDLWPEGWRMFMESPFFGKSFFFVGDFPFKHAEGFIYWYWYHNTPLQVLVNIGIMGAVAFSYLMYRKYVIFAKNSGGSREGKAINFFILLSLIITEIMSLFDIHIFTLAYCVFMLLFLAAAEHFAIEGRTGETGETGETAGEIGEAAGETGEAASEAASETGETGEIVEYNKIETTGGEA